MCRLISFNTSVLAKEKGFGKTEKTFSQKLAWIGKLYNSKGVIRDKYSVYDFTTGYYPAPTMDELSNWLRDEKFIHIEINYEFYLYKYRIVNTKNVEKTDYRDSYCSYYKCLDDALIEALKMI